MSIPDFANEPIARPAPSSASQLEDLITVIPSPSAAMEHRRDGKFGLALLALTAAAVAIYLASQKVVGPYIEADVLRNMHAKMASNPQMTEAMAQKGAAMASKFGVVGLAVAMPLSILVLGLVIWLIGKVFGAKQTYGQAAAVATLSQVPRVLQAVVNWAQALLLTNDAPGGMAQLSASPARLLDLSTAKPALVILLMRFDLFTLWATVLIGIGLAVTGRITRGSAMAAAALVWLLGSALAVMQAL